MSIHFAKGLQYLSSSHNAYAFSEKSASHVEMVVIFAI